MQSAFFSFLHFVAVFGLVGVLAVEWATLGKSPTYREARRLQLSDRWYGIFAVLLLVVGLLRVFYFEKGSAYYFGNLFFHVKIGFFIIVGLLSIYPTVRFLKWRAWTHEGKAPVVPVAEYKALREVIRLELLLVLLIALCAALMARSA